MIGRIAILPSILRLLPVAAFVEYGLRRWTLPRLVGVLGSRLALDDTPAGEVALTVRERRTLYAANAIYRRLPEPGRCLRRSLVVAHALRRRRTAVRIGTASGPHQHAWVEIDGIALDRSAAAFLPLRRARR